MVKMETTYCTNCGQAVVENANFCAQCGNKVNDESTARAHVNLREKINESSKSDDETAKIREHISPWALVSFTLHYLWWSGIVMVLGVVLMFFDPLIGLGVVIGYALVVLLFSYLTWSNFTFTIDDNSFQKQYGIILKRNVSIPLGQIQNVNVNRSLLDMILGLARIDIETAGSTRAVAQQIAGGSSSKAEGHLPGVSLKRARELHDILIERVARQT